MRLLALVLLISVTLRGSMIEQEHPNENVRSTREW